MKTRAIVAVANCIDKPLYYNYSYLYVCRLVVIHTIHKTHAGEKP